MSFEKQPKVPSLWLAEDDPMDSMRSTEELPTACDVVVIGAGVSGCAAALQCQELGLACVLLDARGVAGGASGTNGGHLWPSTDEDKGRKAFEASCAAEVAALLQGAPGPDGSPSLEALGGLELALDGGQMEMLRGEEGEAWSSERVCEALSARPGAFAGGIYHPQACGVWPARAARALARKAVAAGANLQTQTAVQGIAEDEGGGVEVRTARGAVRPGRGVIVCTNGWTPKILPEMEGVIVPARDHVLVTEALPERVWRHSFCAPEAKGSQAGDDFWYGLQLADGRLCVGGGRREGDGGYAYGEDDDGACDERVVAGVEEFLRGHFGGLEGVGVERRWSGVLGFSKDGEPVVGRVPGRRGVWVCAGFGGHGMPACLAFGREAARLVHEGADGSSLPYLKDLSPARFAAGGGGGAGGGDGKAAVGGERAGRPTRSLADKGEDAIPPLGAAPPAEPAGSSLGALPDIHAPADPPRGSRAKAATEEERRELDKEIEMLFGSMGVSRGTPLEDALKPSLTVPLPSFAPATHGDELVGPVVMPKSGGKGGGE